MCTFLIIQWIKYFTIKGTPSYTIIFICTLIIANKILFIASEIEDSQYTTTQKFRVCEIF